MKNFDEGVDLLLNVGLAGMAAADTLVAVLIEEAEADLVVTDGFADVTVTAGTAEKSIPGLSSVNRVIDLGSIDWSDETGGTQKAIAVLSGPSAGAPKLIAVQDTNAGAAVDLSNGYICDGLSFTLKYDGEA